MKFMDGLV